MKKIGLLGIILAAFICVHCSKAEDPERECWLPANSLACEVLATTSDCPVAPVAGADDDIRGKWKLMNTLQPFTSEGRILNDHSCHNTVYHFQVDGTLTISSDREGVPIGQYEYEFKHQPLFEYYDDMGYTLEIGNRKEACSIFEGKMILDNSYVDGPIRYLIRIQ